MEEPSLAQQSESDSLSIIEHMLELYGAELGNRMARKHLGWTIDRLAAKRGLIFRRRSAALWRQRMLPRDRQSPCAPGAQAFLSLRFRT